MLLAQAGISVVVRFEKTAAIPNGPEQAPFLWLERRFEEQIFVTILNRLPTHEPKVNKPSCLSQPVKFTKNNMRSVQQHQFNLFKQINVVWKLLV